MVNYLSPHLERDCILQDDVPKGEQFIREAAPIALNLILGSLQPCLASVIKFLVESPLLAIWSLTLFGCFLVMAPTTW